MNIVALKQLFGRALGFSPLILAGCNGTLDSSYSAIPCNTPQLEGLNPAVIPDLVELWQMQLGSAVRVEAKGVACATASAATACNAALAALKPDAGIRDSIGYRMAMSLNESYLVTSLGDEVRAHTTMPELLAFLGTIDTVPEALLVGRVTGYRFACGDRENGATRAFDGGFELVGTSGVDCGRENNLSRHFLTVKGSGAVVETHSQIIRKGDPGCSIGRRPCGLVDRGPRRLANPLGTHFASAAHLEASSVPAFLFLRDDLAFHGAPASIGAEAIAAAADEVRHTRTTAALARRFGAEPEAPQVHRPPRRSLFEVAVENAIEGCVRETYGALVAHHQAAHAGDPAIRRAMRSIAEDETRHAALSWKVQAWALRRLSTSDRTAMRRAQQAAVETLRAEVAVEPDRVLVCEAGLPTAARASALVEGLQRELWA